MGSKAGPVSTASIRHGKHQAGEGWRRGVRTRSAHRLPLVVGELLELRGGLEQ